MFLTDPAAKEVESTLAIALSIFREIDQTIHELSCTPVGFLASGFEDN